MAEVSLPAVNIHQLLITYCNKTDILTSEIELFALISCA
jgi:hypothetical protein